MTVGLNIFALIALLFATGSIGATFGFVICALCKTSARADASECDCDCEQATFRGDTAT